MSIECVENAPHRSLSEFEFKLRFLVHLFFFRRSALQYFNEQALADEDFAINFALLFTSCHFDGLREHLQSSDGNSIFRAHILNMLQQNYSSKNYDE